jgi:hypothetical protein
MVAPLLQVTANNVIEPIVLAGIAGVLGILFIALLGTIANAYLLSQGLQSVTGVNNIAVVDNQQEDRPADGRK